MTGVRNEAMPCNPKDESMLPDHFRATVAAVLSRHFSRNVSSPRLAEKLGAGRWRIEWPAGGMGRRFDLYVSRGSTTVLCVWVRDGRWEIMPEGDLVGDAAVNLGDCLLRAVCQGARRIVLHLREGDRASLEAEGVLESFARAFAEGAARAVAICGTGPAARALSRALRGGAKHDPSPRRAAPVQRRASSTCR